MSSDRDRAGSRPPSRSLGPDRRSSSSSSITCRAAGRTASASDGYRFSPGVHYIGDLGEGGGVRRLYEGLGLSRDLEFCELNPEGFDHFIIAGERIDQPRGLDRWMKRLKARFPHEREGIDRYFGTLGEIARDIKKCDTLLSFPEVLTVPFRAPSLIRWGFRTLSALLDACVSDPMLMAVLSAQSGNHGLAPSRVSLPIHAAMTSHYHNGAFYPRGGGKSIARAYIKELRRRGGEIRTEGPREADPRRGRAGRRRRDRGRRDDPRRQRGLQRRPGRHLRQAPRARALQRADPQGEADGVLGQRALALLRGGHRPPGHGPRLGQLLVVPHDATWTRSYARMEREMPGAEVDVLFLAITTLKDPGHWRTGTTPSRCSPSCPTSRSRDGRDRRKAHATRATRSAKRELGDEMLEAAENMIPGLRRNLKFLEVGTPLTNDFYCETYRGASYGTAKTPFQLGPFSFSQRGPVAGLHLCGASTISHGVAGASMSGLVAAQHVLGRATTEELLGPLDGSLRVYPADRPEEWLDHERTGPARQPVAEPQAA